MYQATRVEVFETSNDTSRDLLKRLVAIVWGVDSPALRDALEVRSWNILEGDPGVAVVYARIVHLHDVGVLERGEGLILAFEAFEVFGDDLSGVQNLNGDPVTVWLPRFEDRSERTAADRFVECVGPDALTRYQKAP